MSGAVIFGNFQRPADDELGHVDAVKRLEVFSALGVITADEGIQLTQQNRADPRMPQARPAARSHLRAV